MRCLVFSLLELGGRVRFVPLFCSFTCQMTVSGVSSRSRPSALAADTEHCMVCVNSQSPDMQELSLKTSVIAYFSGDLIIANRKGSNGQARVVIVCVDSKCLDCVAARINPVFTPVTHNSSSILDSHNSATEYTGVGDIRKASAMCRDHREHSQFQDSCARR